MQAQYQPHQYDSGGAASVDINHVCHLLELTLNQDNEQRKQAEEGLIQLAQNPGYISTLLRLVTSDVSVTAKQCAAAQFKVTARRFWGNLDRENPSPIPENEKQFVRDNIVEAILREVNTPVYALLIQGAVSIFSEDFPDRWQDLPQTCLTNLSSIEPRRVYNTSLLLRKCFKHLEYKGDQHRSILYSLADPTLPQLHNILSQCATHDSFDAAHQSRIILKSYWSCIQFKIGGYCAQPQALETWLSMVMYWLQRELPANHPTDPEEQKESPFWKCKKWASMILARFANRYGSPKLVEENQAEAARYFNKNILAKTLPPVVQQLDRFSKDQYVSSRVLLHSFDYLRAAVEFGSCYRHLKPYLQFLIENVFLKLFKFNDEDQELFESDKTEFIRVTYNDIQDWLSPRLAAATALENLVEKREKEVMPVVMETCYRALENYNNCADPQAKDYRLKEGVLVMIGHLHMSLLKRKKYKKSMEDFIGRHVAPELNSSLGWLRARALWLFGLLSSVNFQDVNTFREMVKKTLQMYEDPEPAVRFVAAYITRFLLRKDAAKEIIRPILPQVVEVLFKMANDIQADDIVSSLNELLDEFSAEVTALAAPLIEKFVAFFQMFFKEGENETDPDGGETLDMASLNCLEGIQTVLHHMEYSDEIWAKVEPQVLPVVEFIVGQNAFQLEFFEDALSILSLCVEKVPTITQRLWRMLEMVFNALENFAPDFIEEGFMVLQAYLEKDVRGILNGGPQGNMNLVERAWSVHEKMVRDLSENEQAWSSRMILSILIYGTGGLCDRYIPEILVKIMQQLEHSKTGDVRIAFTSVVAGCFFNNARLSLEVLENRSMTMKAFEYMTKSTEHHLSRLDKKVTAIGLLAAIEQLPLDQSGWSERAIELYRVASTLLKQRYKLINEQESDDDEEEEEDNEDDIEESDDEDDAISGGEEEEDEQPVEIGETEDTVNEEDEAYMKLLQAEAEKMREADAGLGDFYEKSAGQPETGNSPLDHINEYGALINALQTGKLSQIYSQVVQSLSDEERQWLEECQGLAKESEDNAASS